MSLRREIRLRKEFLFKKQKDVEVEKRSAKKQMIKASIEQGKSIPTELRAEARELEHDLSVNGEGSALSAEQDYDDEYATMGMRDPKVCVTTSRDPSSRLKQFTKEIKLCIPNAQAINRGNVRVNELVDACKKADFTDLVVLNETRGNPDSLIVSHLPFGPTASFTLSSAVLRNDIPDCQPVSEASPHLILENLETKVGARIAKILKALYPVPKADSKRVITFANTSDFISFRHHVYTKEKGKVAIRECGPRFEMQPYEIKLGTWEQADAETEWALRPFMNTSRKRKAL